MDVLDNINNLLDNQTVTIVVSLILALYSALAAPALPNSVILFFDTIPGKVLLLFLIGFTASRNIQVSLMIAVAFVITLHIANKRVTEQYINFLTRENFISTNQYTEEADSPEENEDAPEEDGPEEDGPEEDGPEEQSDAPEEAVDLLGEGFKGAIRKGIERFNSENQPEEVNISDGEEDVNVDERFNSENQPEEVDVDEKFNDDVDIEEFDNYTESFYSNIEQWKQDGVKPAYNLSGNSKNNFAPVKY